VISVAVQIHNGPLPDAPPPCPREGAGAVLCFEGRVRPTEDEQSIAALEYEVYEPMAQQMLCGLAEELLRSHGLCGISVEHSRGRVEVGQCSFRLQVAAPHRQEAIEAVALFIDRMKADIPIWKTPIP
jgi:molybdopterin synthase catalytic subunit